MIPDRSTWALGRMRWPWEGHEGCVVYLLRDQGYVAGRVCKQHGVSEVHLLARPGEGVDRLLVEDPAPAGSC